MKTKIEMKKKRKTRPSTRGLLLAALAIVVAVGCVTVNVYFPDAAVKDLSEQIEEAVARQAAKDSDADGAQPQAAIGAAIGARLLSLVGTVIHHLGPAPVYAAEGDVAAPEITNPAIRRIIQSRAARVDELNRFKARGVLGEGRDALVVVRSLDDLELAERAAVQRLVRQENADREEMFKEIAAATGTDLSQLPRIKETYAETLREKARPGDWVERPDGTWTQK